MKSVITAASEADGAGAKPASTATSVGDAGLGGEMRIVSKEQAEALRGLIGDQNTEACGRAIADGALVWVFQTEDEIGADPDLTAEEKEKCLRILRQEGLGYAGWFRPPVRPRQVPGFTPVSGCDSHGNARGGYSGGGDNWSH